MTVVSFPLANTGEVLVDQADLPALAGRTWSRVKCGNKFYACSASRSQTPKRLYMHRFLLGLHMSSRPWVDHIDGDGLNNARSNLRTATPSLNAYNRPVDAAYRNVYPQSGGFIVRIGRTYGGFFPTTTRAAIAADDLAKKLFGDGALLNFPSDLGSPFLSRRFLEVA